MYMLLRFSSLFQSWGIREDWENYRRTASCPEKSAVAGIIGCAMGIWREEQERLEEIQDEIKSITLISSYPNPRLMDFQTVTGHFFRASGSEYDGTILLYKEYLVDCLGERATVIAIEGSENFLSSVRDALRHPKYPFYYGRANCPPAGNILEGGGKIYDTLPVSYGSILSDAAGNQ